MAHGFKIKALSLTSDIRTGQRLTIEKQKNKKSCVLILIL